MNSEHEAYAAESADFDRVLGAVAQIRAASMEELGSFEWLVARIREAGLVPIPDWEAVYGEERDFLNASQQGLIQLPREFAAWLQLTAEFCPATYLEIGCFNGASVCLAAAYLQRFNPAFQATTLDLWPSFIFREKALALLPLRYVVGRTSFDFASEQFDAVFIDGDHSFEWAWADYTNVGRAARICGLHDVRNAPYRELPLGGVCGVWDLLQRTECGAGIEFTEFSEHPTGNFMGIGVRSRRGDILAAK